MTNSSSKPWLIYNPGAGAFVRRGKDARRLADVLAQSGMPVEAIATKAPGHATELAREAVACNVPLVIGAGGDGTINEVLNGIAPSQIPLAVLPCGTANVLAAEIGLPGDIERAARQLPSLRPVRVAAGRVHPDHGAPRWFLCMAGAGLDADVVRTVDPKIKRHLGQGAYWIAGWSRIGQRTAQFRVRNSEFQADTGFALVSRTRQYGGRLVLANRASLLRDDFQVVTFDGRTTWPFTVYLPAAMLGVTTRLPGVRSAFSRHLRLEPAPGERVSLQVDGELVGNLPATVETVPDSVTLMVPEAFARGEAHLAA